MKQQEQFTAKVGALWQKVQPYLQKAAAAYRKTKHFCRKAWPWVWPLRKIVLAIPVVYLALYFARLNWNALPEQVGIHLLSNGEYAQYITRELAVYGPLGVTGGCLAMMFLSRKTVYPWMICIFSMLLPALLLITNIFPA